MADIEIPLEERIKALTAAFLLKRQTLKRILKENRSMRIQINDLKNELSYYRELDSK